MSVYYGTVLGRLKEMIEKHEDLLWEVYGEEVLEVLRGSEEEVREVYDEDGLSNLCKWMNDSIRIKESEIDLDKLIKALEGTRGGVGFDAFMEVKCKRCKCEVVRENGVYPEMCFECAFDMAYDVCVSGYRVTENEVLNRNRLADALQGTVGKLGMCVMTAYVCGDCGEEKMSGSHLIPRMCYACALGLADRVMACEGSILKD